MADKREGLRGATPTCPNQGLMMENNMRIVVLTIMLLSCASPTFSQTAAPEPIKPPTTQDNYQDAYRKRIMKINERIQRKQIEAACKAKAKKAFSAIHFRQRRSFIRDCIARAHS
jgi:hypothetical protein